LEIKNSN